MKKYALRIVTLLSLTLVVAAASARAQGVGGRAVLNIPFDFTAGGKHLASGEYVVAKTDTTITIRSKDGRRAVVVLPIRTMQSAGNLSESRLVFRQYGDSYILAEAWISSQNTGYALRLSRDVRQLARNGAAGQEVTVIAGR